MSEMFFHGCIVYRIFLQKCGMMNIWNNHNFPNIKWLTLSIRKKLSKFKGDEQKISRDRNCKRSRQNCRQQGNVLTISVRKHFCIEIIYSLSTISHFQLSIGV